MNSERQIRRPQAGQALLELALLLPLFLLLIMGMVDLGRYMYVYILVSNAARAGAGYGAQSLAQSGDTTGIAAAAQADYANSGGVSTLSVRSAFSCVCDTSGTLSTQACISTEATACKAAAGNWIVTLAVTTSGSYNAVFGLPGIPSPITVTNTATMTVAPI